jgi:hypothetical protein
MSTESPVFTGELTISSPDKPKVTVRQFVAMHDALTTFARARLDNLTPVQAAQFKRIAEEALKP